MPPRHHVRTILLLAGVPAALLLAVYIYSITDAGLDTAPLPRPEVNAPFIRTPDEIVDEMLKLADPAPDELLYDLGCGDGRIVIAAAQRYGCRAVGYDIDPQRVNEAREKVRSAGLEDRVTIVEQDVFTLDLSDADVVMFYLLPRLNARLLPQLRQMRSGARIVSHDFDLPGVEPDRTVVVHEQPRDVEHTLYLWTAPLAPSRKTASSGGPKFRTAHDGSWHFFCFNPPLFSSPRARWSRIGEDRPSGFRASLRIRSKATRLRKTSLGRAP